MGMSPHAIDVLTPLAVPTTKILLTPTQPPTFGRTEMSTDQSAVMLCA